MLHHKNAAGALLPLRRRWLPLSISCLLMGVPVLLHAQSNDATANAPAAATPAATAPASTAPAAQSSSSVMNLNKIVVTAQKREQQVEDVPISMAAYSGDFLKTLGITTLEDLGRYVPSLQLQIENVNNATMSIRGISGGSRVSVFEDGIDITGNPGSVMALYDMDRIEVLNGPQSTLFGRGAESGALSLITNKANDTLSSGFSTEFGNYGSHMETGYINFPVSSSVDARVALYDNENDGFIKNTEGGTLNGSDTKAARLSLHFKIGEHSSYDLIANYERDTPPGTDFRGGLLNPATGAVTIQPNVYGSTNIWGAASLTNPGFDGNDLGVRQKAYGLTGIGTFELNDNWTLTSTTGLRRVNSVEWFDADGSQVDMLNFGNIQHMHEASQEVRFNFDNGGRFTGFFGANFFYQNGSQTAPFETNEQSLLVDLIPLARQLDPGIASLLFGSSNPSLLNAANQPNTPYSAIPLLGTKLNTDETEGYTSGGSTRAYELFADGTFHVTDSFDITAGARVSHEKITSSYQVFNSNGAVIGPALAIFGAGVNGITSPNDIFPPTHGVISDSDSKNSAVGRVIGSYHMGEDTNAYVSVSRGRLPDSLVRNTVPAYNAAGTKVGSEYVWQVLPAEILMNYEVGMKGGLADGKFVYDVSAFYYNYKNFQTQSYTNGQLLTVNSGRANAPGFETALQQAITDNLSAYLNYSYLHARFDSTDSNGNPQQYAGNHLSQAPDHDVVVGLLYSRPLVNDVVGYVRPSFSWRSKVYFQADNNPNYVQSAYGLLNLRMGVTFDKARWDVGLFGNNLTNKKYVIDAGCTGEDFNVPCFIPGAPRTFGVSISAKF